MLHISVLMIKLYILLGGNLGDKLKFLSEARARLSQHVGTITNQSVVYETEPWGFESDDIFWNQVIELSTPLSPEEVLVQTQHIEHELDESGKQINTIHGSLILTFYSTETKSSRPKIWLFHIHEFRNGNLHSFHCAKSCRN